MKIPIILFLLFFSLPAIAQDDSNSIPVENYHQQVLQQSVKYTNTSSFWTPLLQALEFILIRPLVLLLSISINVLIYLSLFLSYVMGRAMLDSFVYFVSQVNFHLIVTDLMNNLGIPENIVNLFRFFRVPEIFVSILVAIKMSDIYKWIPLI